MNRLLILAYVIGIGAAAGGSPVDLPQSTSILMENGSPYYIPATATTVSGTPIRWENPTPTHHTVTYSGCGKEGSLCLFDSGTVPPGGHFTVSGLPAGRYTYECRIHPIMRGQLTVMEDPGVSSPL